MSLLVVLLLKATSIAALGRVGQAATAGRLMVGLSPIAAKGYDASVLRALVGWRGACANIPPKSNRKIPICFSRHLYRDRTLIERFFSKIKKFYRILTRNDKLAKTSSQASSSHL